MSQRMRMKDLPSCERPIEKIQSSGVQSVSNQELLAALIGIGSHEASALELAGRILSNQQGLRGLAQADMHSLKAVKGIGPAKAAKLLAALELGKRLYALEADVKVKLNAPTRVYEHFKGQLRYERVEKFCTATVNTKNELLSIKTISVGTINASLVHPREVFQSAIKEQAYGMILVHNHPSGNPEPSREDQELTKRLVEAGKLIGIHILDHIVIGDDRYYSFKENDRL